MTIAASLWALPAEVVALDRRRVNRRRWRLGFKYAVVTALILSSTTTKKLARQLAALLDATSAHRSRCKTHT
jgi:hypothetical protein